MSDPAAGDTPQKPAHLESLRHAMALGRAMHFLQQEPQEAATTVEHDEAKRMLYIEKLLIRAHRALHHDWKAQATAAHRPGEMVNSDAKKTVREAILDSLCTNGEHISGKATLKKLFDSNGYVIHHESKQLAAILADFYKKIHAAKPFDYGNEQTLDVFMVALSKIPAFQEVYPNGIDFRRLDTDEMATLHNDASPTKTLAKIFSHALDPLRTPALRNPANGHGRWEKHMEYVAGIPFLSHKREDGTKCLVTINGGLVPLDAIGDDLARHFAAEKMLADIPPITASQIVGYLPGTAHLREYVDKDGHVQQKTDIDGVPATAQAAPLFCLDENILTGLRDPVHKELAAILAAHGHKNIFDLGNNEALKNALLAEAENDPRRRHIVEIAHTRLSAITNKLNSLLKDIFADKTPVLDPKFIKLMGGAGSGKESGKDIAQALCGNNFVTPSLDDNRMKSDRHAVLTAANHHGDDYVAIEPFANTLRQWVADYAQGKNYDKQQYNVLYDGTGVVYKPRYADIVKDFKDSGFKTYSIGVDVALEKAIDRVKGRFKATGRALPWIVTTGKHVRTPGSFQEAVEDGNLDKIALFANDRGPGEHHLVAESFILSDRELKELQAHQKNGSLAEHFKSMIKTHADSILAGLSRKEGDLDQVIGRIPDFSNANASYIAYPAPDENRVLAIYDNKRFIEFQQKGAMNAHSSDKAGLRHTPGTLPIVAGREAKSWREALNRPLAAARSVLSL